MRSTALRSTLAFLLLCFAQFGFAAAHSDGRPTLVKVVMIGDSGTGKSSMLVRYTDNFFTDSYITTIGMDYKFKEISLKEKGKKDKSIRLQIWDTAGQERFRSITRAYYSGAHGFIFVFDVTEVTSLNKIEYWINDIEKKAVKKVPWLLVGNKADQPRAVVREDAEEFAKQHDMTYIETSAKKDVNIGAAFLTIAQQAYEKKEADEAKRRQDAGLHPLDCRCKECKTRDGESSCCGR